MSMNVFAVRYTYTDESEQNAARDEHRAAHRAFLAELGADGSLLGSGPLVDGVDAPSALLIIAADQAADVRDLLRDDPFQQQGLVERVTVEEWSLILGPWAER